MPRLRIDAAAKERVIGALAVGADMALAAKAIGVSRQALYLAMKRDAKFKVRTEDARAIADDTVQRSLYRMANGGNVVAAIFWLKNRRPAEWRDRQETKPVADEPGSILIEETIGGTGSGGAHVG